MKKIFIIGIVVSLVAFMGVFAVGNSSVFAVKPAGNLAGAEEVAWNLSGAVMPMPPYGLSDIPGSDTASKLIVNQPNGATEVAITGIMNGLNPNTAYTVRLENEYTPYEFTGWDITGGWTFIAEYYSGKYEHKYNITQDSMGEFTGTGSYETIYGIVDPFLGTITFFHSDYNNGYWYEATGTIDPATGAISGTWGNDSQGYGHPWYSTLGNAIKNHTGDIWSTGLFTSTVPPFTFTTDDYGSGSWHLNLRDSNFPGPGTYMLSVWINKPGASILVSDNFTVVVD